MTFAAEGTQIVDLKGHTVIPCLNDSPPAPDSWRPEL